MRRASRLSLVCGFASDMPDDGINSLPKRKGNLFHAWVAGRVHDTLMHDAAYAKAMNELAKAPKAVEEVRGWMAIAEQKLPWGKLADAEFETPIGLDDWGSACMHDAPDAVTGGHPDAWWREGDHIVVIDFKTGVSDLGPPEKAPQLMVYGAALGLMHDMPVALAWYYARTGAFIWSPIHRVDVRTVVRAATLPPTPVTGPHCREGYCVRRCPHGQAWIAEQEKAA